MKKLENGILKLVNEKGELDNTKVFAFKDESGQEIVLSNELYLGKNDDGSRYYEKVVEECQNDLR